MKLSIFLMLMGTAASAGGLVYYKDADGNIHAADSLDGIPEKYRAKTKTTQGRAPDSNKFSVVLKKEGNSMLVPVSLGKVQTTLVLDTGASMTLIPTSVSQQLGLKHLRVAQLTTASGQVSAPIVMLPEISVGHMAVKNMEAAVFDIPGGGEAKGLLGLDFLNHFKTTIDSSKGRLDLERK